MVHGVWFMVCSSWCVVHGVWFMVYCYGVRPIVYRSWCVVYGIYGVWFMVCGSWCVVHGILSEVILLDDSAVIMGKAAITQWYIKHVI